METTFRITFITIFVVNVLISAFFRSRARQSEVLSRRSEPRRLRILRIIFALPLFATILIYSIQPDWLAWARLPLPVWLRWLAVVSGFLTIPLMYWLFKTIGGNVSETVLTKPNHQLVTNGPYRLVRHPLYTASSAMLIALSLIAANGFMLAATGAVIAALPIIAREEEKNLIAKFGDDYRNYMQRTGRFLPWLTLKIETEKLTPDSLGSTSLTVKEIDR